MNKTSHLNFIFSVSVFFYFSVKFVFNFSQKIFSNFFGGLEFFENFQIFPKIFSIFFDIWLNYLMKIFSEDYFLMKINGFWFDFWRLLLCTISSNEQFLFFSGAKGAEGIKMFRKEHGGEVRNVENGGGHHHCTTRSDFEIDADYYFHRFSFLTG